MPGGQVGASSGHAAGRPMRAMPRRGDGQAGGCGGGVVSLRLECHHCRGRSGPATRSVGERGAGCLKDLRGGRGAESEARLARARVRRRRAPEEECMKVSCDGSLEGCGAGWRLADAAGGDGPACEVVAAVGLGRGQRHCSGIAGPERHRRRAGRTRGLLGE